MEDAIRSLELLGEKLKSRIKLQDLVTAIQTFNTASVEQAKGLLEVFQPNASNIPILATEDPLNPSRIPDTTDVRIQSCPLERMMAHSRPGHGEQYPLQQFVNWIEAEAKAAESRIMPITIKSAHLFRSRSAPLHHEFAIVCFGIPSLPDSWIRIERAARRKVASLLMQPDSFSPLFGGVRLRETVKFGTRIEDMQANADELASVSFVPPTNGAPDDSVAGYLHLSEFSRLLYETSTADPLYQLFSTNCRWFARRTVLSVAQQLQAINVASCIQWKSKEVTIEILISKLLDDWFGGRQMAGTRALEIRASNLINMARASLLNQRFASASKHSSEALDLLRHIVAPSQVQLALLCTASWYLGGALLRRNLLVDSYLSLQRARYIGGKVLGRDTRLIDELYAQCLERLGRTEEALVLRAATIASRRAEILAKGEQPDLLDYLANSLVSHASALLELGRPEDALPIIMEARNIGERLVDHHLALYQCSFMEALSIFAGTLALLGSPQDAHTAALQSLTIARELYTSYPDATCERLALRLCAYGMTCQELNRLDEATEAFKESTHLWAFLYEKSSPDFLSEYASSLAAWQSNLGYADRYQDARELVPRLVELETLVHQLDPNRFDKRFSERMYTSAMVLMLTGDSVAIELGKLAIEASHRVAKSSEDAVPTLLIRLVSLGRISRMPYDHGMSWAVESLHFGYEAIKQALTAWEDYVAQGKLSPWEELADAPVSLASTFLTLSEYESTFGRPRFALTASLRTLKIFLLRFRTEPSLMQEEFDLLESQNLCCKALDMIYQSTDMEALPLAQEHIITFEELIDAFPNHFTEADLSVQLSKHAAWIVSNLKQSSGISSFETSIEIARRLCNKSSPRVPLEYRFALARALHAYGHFLIHEDLARDAQRGLELLQESFELTKNITSPDDVQYAGFACLMTDDYSSTLYRILSGRVPFECDEQYLLTVLHGRMASVLGLKAAAMWHLNEREKGLEIAEEALSYHRLASHVNPSKQRYPLAEFLLQYAVMMEGIGESDVAVATRYEALKLTRGLVADQSVPVKVLVDQLLSFALYCQREKLLETASELFTEAIPYLRLLSDTEDDEGDLENLIQLVRVTRCHAVAESDLGREHSAITSAAEHLAVLHRLALAIPEQYSHDLQRGIESFRTNLNRVGWERYPEYVSMSFLESTPGECDAGV
ncbi:hypothetical protein DL93DRAFT_795484 [Clavulina sp. PMI_390]|nr:hypothetical protein DL93DRAFT_795484 [Clavulina sp. PMI_390]